METYYYKDGKRLHLTCQELPIKPTTTSRVRILLQDQQDLIKEAWVRERQRHKESKKPQDLQLTAKPNG